MDSVIHSETRREYIPVGSGTAASGPATGKPVGVQLRAKHALQALASPMLRTGPEQMPESIFIALG